MVQSWGKSLQAAVNQCCGFLTQHPAVSPLQTATTEPTQGWLTQANAAAAWGGVPARTLFQKARLQTVERIHPASRKTE